MEAYKETLALDASDATPEEKAAAWRRLGRGEKAFAAAAGKRAAEWAAYASAKTATDAKRLERVRERDADWEKLERLLSQDALAEADKGIWSERFLKAYWISPGVDAEMAAALAPHAPPGAMRTALAALARKVRQKEPAANGGDASLRAPAGSTGIEWITIPGGTFTMGYGAEELDAQPAHRVSVKTFQMAKTLVTNKQYKACVAAGACTPPVDYGPLSDGDDQPVVGVDWSQARAYSIWAGGRLPSEAEWEYAARGAGRNQEYPWGDEEATCERAVIFGCADRTQPVCSRPKGNTAQGLCDMAGNAWEWVEDWYRGSYNGAPADGGAWEDSGSSRVKRGGSIDANPFLVRVYYRDRRSPIHRNARLSFRPVR